MKDKKPEAYTPQVVGLGPYHHLRPEVQQMESRKRDAVKKYIKRHEFKDFIKLVNEMTEKGPDEMPEGVPEKIREKFEPTIRCSYDRYLDLDGKTLSWIMVVDGIFLLHVVKNYLEQKELNQKVDPEIERLVPDIFMLENQIPLKLLKQIRKALKRSFTEATDIDLDDKFNRFCIEHSPLKLSDEPELMEEAFEKHMLHYMYKLIVENYDHQQSGAGDGGTSSQESLEESVEREPEKPDDKSSERCSANICVLAEKTVSQVTDVFMQVRVLTAAQAKDVVKQVGDSVSCGFDQVINSGVKVPTNIEQTVKYLKLLKKNSNPHDEISNRVVEEMDIPSVSELYQIAKLKFVRTDGGIRNFRKDLNNTTPTIYLPVITLHANSEVILRNLMAYEVASAKPGSTWELTEYLEFMCGIVDTENDVKLLKKEKIIQGDLRVDEIVAIFNGINKFIENPDEKSRLQKIAQELNERYNKQGIVKAYNSIKKFVGRFQGLMTQLFPLLVLILLTLQFICETSGCSSRRFGLPWDSSSGNGSSLSMDSQANYLMIPRKMLRN